MTSDAVPAPADPPSVVVARTGRGWRVLAPGCAQDVDDLVEGLSLADLVAEGIGCPAEPDRAARRAARGGADADAGDDPRDARIAALERTVAQLEHALAARVVTERAIGVLAERHATAPRTAFEVLRAQARSLGRPVHELAREVMATLDRLGDHPPPGSPAEAGPVLTPVPRRAPGRRVERGHTRPGPAVPADGRH
ncbi:ANTAR domain-containing protein [Geodermatophilus obscurus]|uniref:ANTAR domain-containing protein n=1 Tax=Geodermatophilus obscurus TaxID=1861 RepID=A0A1I5GUR1_9ACTN|nr:ANTAR domain-containing protein [Geodermatophilus obscurus]SFO39748.1 ANTAR domain-containing protein [Geodermatophilus obscurus]